MDWIPVNKNLPALQQPVLVMIEPAGSYQSSGNMQVAYLSPLGWCNQFGLIKEVKHWLPLPPPPTDEHFEGIKFAADSVVSQYVPADNALTALTFEIISDGITYRVNYARENGYWEFKSYEKT